MTINWGDVAKAAWSLILLVAGALLSRVLERKPKLTYYSTHWVAYPWPGPPPVTLHTHGIVLKNVGRKTATDVRLRHRLRTDRFYLDPDVPREDVDLPEGGFEIVLPMLRPQEELAIWYMHRHPFNDFRGRIAHSDGFAVEVSALAYQASPTWLLRIVQPLALLGAITALYLVVQLGRLLLRFF